MEALLKEILEELKVIRSMLEKQTRTDICEEAFNYAAQESAKRLSLCCVRT